MQMARRRLVRTALRDVAALVLVAVLAAPAAAMVVGSFRAPLELSLQGLSWMPSGNRLYNYETVFALVPLEQMLLRSLLVATIAVPITVLVASLAGYAIATGSAVTRRYLVTASVAALLVPPVLLWLPRFISYRWLAVLDSPVPLVAPALMAGSPLFVLLLALAYSRVPRVIVEAARVEGLGELAIWRRVSTPLVRPTLLAVAALAFVASWSNFIDALLYLSSAEQFTVPVGLRSLGTLEAGEYPVVLAGATVASVPPIAAFVLAERALFERSV